MLDFQNHPMAEATKSLNAATFLVIMLETPDAISNVDEIAAVSGVDALLIGTNDLCMESVSYTHLTLPTIYAV